MMHIDWQLYLGPLCIDVGGGHWRYLSFGVALSLHTAPLDPTLTFTLGCFSLSFVWCRDWRDA